MQHVALTDLIRSAQANHRDEAERIFENVFSALMWTHVVDGKVTNRSPLEQWKHRQISEIEYDIAYLEINRSALLAALSEYLSNPALISKQADWLYLNVLAYAEYTSTVCDIRRHVMGVERYVEKVCRPTSQHTTDNTSLATRPWHLPLLLCAVTVCWFIHPLAGTGMTAYALFNGYRQKKARGKINATTSSMLQTYLSFNTADLSWVQVMSSLEHSRDAGAIWDASLYALAQRRIDSPIPTVSST